MAYNNEFDFHPRGLGSPDWLADIGIPLGPCLLQRAKFKMGLGRFQPGGTLIKAMEHFGIERVGDAHSALSDVDAAAALIPYVWSKNVQRGRVVDARMDAHDGHVALFTRADWFARQAVSVSQ